jgi:hypothetical protein
MSEEVYLRDLDGTGSMHVCSDGDAGFIPYLPADLPPTDAQIVADERVKDVCRWLKASLGCPAFVWDPDQREMAEYALAQLKDNK